MNYDLIVIGAGPGGYVAAIRAAQLGAKVALIEKEALGGTCLNHGCIPTKAIIAAAERIYFLKTMGDFGIMPGGWQVEYPKVIERKEKIVRELAAGIEQLLKSNKIELIKGEGKITSPHKVTVGGQVLESKFILIAAGTAPSSPKNIEIDHADILSSNDILALKELPKSLLIVGGGVIACEIACAFNLFGVNVTLVELLPSILPSEDALITRMLTKILVSRGISIKTGLSVQDVRIGYGNAGTQEGDAGRGPPDGAQNKMVPGSVFLVPGSIFVRAPAGVSRRQDPLGGISGAISNSHNERVTVLLSDDSIIEVEKALIATGRKVDMGPLGIDELRVQHDRNGIVVDDRMATNVLGVYAIGDCVGKTMTAHGASAEGIAAIENMFGKGERVDYDSIPRAVYTIPPVATIGAREKELKAAGVEYSAGRFSYASLGRALCDGAEGIAQIYADPKGKILGAAFLGHSAVDLVNEVAIAMKAGLTASDLARTIHAHPSYGEALTEAAFDLTGEAIHKVLFSRSDR